MEGPARGAGEAELRRQLDDANRAMWALYKELDDKNGELERSNAELDQFALIAGHDMQEPLRKVMAFGDRLKEEYGNVLDARGQDYIERMQSASTRMIALIGDLMSYARVTSQAQPHQPTDLNMVAADVESDLEDRCRREKGRIDFGPLPTVEADPIQMHQLLQNLVGNGLKFRGPDRAPLVTVRAETRDTDDGPMVDITVADNGIGFDERFAERIFQPFRRLRGAGAYEGTGMGLAICQKIALRHGGALSARGTLGEGSCFTVTLPVTQARAESHEESD